MIRPMLTAGVYFQYEAKHRCRTKFENQTSSYNHIEESNILQALTPTKTRNNQTSYDSCNLVSETKFRNFLFV